MSVRTFKPAKQSTEPFNAIALMKECSSFMENAPRKERIIDPELQLAIAIAKPKSQRDEALIARLNAMVRKTRATPAKKAVAVVVAKPVDRKKQLLAQAAAARTPEARAAREAAQALAEMQAVQERLASFEKIDRKENRLSEKAEAKAIMALLSEETVNGVSVRNGIVIRME